MSFLESDRELSRHSYYAATTSRTQTHAPLAGAILVFTLGYSSIYGRLQEQLTSLSPGKALWLSHGFMAGRVVLGLGVLFTVGWLLVHADLIPDMATVRGEFHSDRYRWPARCVCRPASGRARFQDCRSP